MPTNLISVSGARTALNAFVHSPQARGLARAGKGLVPFAAAGGIGAAAYSISPEFKYFCDQARDFLKEHQLLSESLMSGIFMGLIPDYLAQRYSGETFNPKRSLLMTCLAAFSGGIMLRNFYNWLNAKFPENAFWINQLKIGIDQITYSPLYLAFYLTATNAIKGGTWVNFGHKLWGDFKNVQPKSWLFWWPFGAQIVYFSPMDLRIYEVCVLSILWFGFLSNFAHSQKQQ